MSTPWRHLTSGCEHECCSIARPGTLKPVLRDRSCDPRLKCEVAFRVPVHCQASAGPPPGLSCVFAGPAPVLCRASGPRRGPRRCHRHWCRQGSRRGLRPPPPRVFDDSCKTDRRRDLRDLRRNVFHQVRAESANNVRCAPEAIKQRSIAADHIFINCSQNIEHFGLCEKSCGFPDVDAAFRPRGPRARSWPQAVPAHPSVGLLRCDGLPHAWRCRHGAQGDSRTPGRS